MGEETILFVVEGEARDYRFAEEMARCFLRGGTVKVISVPAAQNIYMLYKRLVEDDFETDVVELLRESNPSASEKLEGTTRREISQIYLFFDYDPQAVTKGLFGVNTGVLERMLTVFDNETDNGKLYISYPMVEALYDYERDRCQAFSGCFVHVNDVGSYKHLAGNDNPNASLRMDIVRWEELIAVFVLRVKCLFDMPNLSFEAFRASITPKSIFQKENELLQGKEKVFVLSGFPEFLLDYHKRSFWNSKAQLKRWRFDSCERGRTRD